MLFFHFSINEMKKMELKTEKKLQIHHSSLQKQCPLAVCKQNFLPISVLVRPLSTELLSQLQAHSDGGMRSLYSPLPSDWAMSVYF